MEKLRGILVVEAHRDGERGNSGANAKECSEQRVVLHSRGVDDSEQRVERKRNEKELWHERRALVAVGDEAHAQLRGKLGRHHRHQHAAFEVPRGRARN